MTKRKRITSEGSIPSDRLRMLIGFVGQDLLMHTKKKAQTQMERQVIEVSGKILGGRFKLTVQFDGEAMH